MINKNTRAIYDKGRPKGSIINKTDIDHTLQVAEITRNPEAAAYMTLEEKVNFANSKENLYEMNSSHNRSKKDLSTSEWLNTPNSNGQKPDEIFDLTKEKKKEYLNKEKEARSKFKEKINIGKKRTQQEGLDSQINEAKRISSKALKAIVMSLLVELVRNIIGELIKWLKEKKKSFESFIDKVKIAITNFINNLNKNLYSAANVISSTIISSIFGPITGMLNKILLFVKQGFNTIKEIIVFLNKPENKKLKSDSLFAEITKIVVVGLTASGSIVMGEFIEMLLLNILLFNIQIPLLGSLGSIFGIFLGAVFSGIAGALIMNILNDFINTKIKDSLLEKRIDKANDILDTQDKLKDINEMKLKNTKNNIKYSIGSRHIDAATKINDTLNNIEQNLKRDESTDATFDEIDKLLSDLMEGN